MDFRLLILTIVTLTCWGSVHFEIEPIDMATTDLKVEAKIFKNYRDHYNERDMGMYDQRYWISKDFWDPTDPKVIIYICGEGTGHFPNEKTLPLVAAQEVKAAVIALEHRYYGESQPFPDWTVEHLKLLNHEQALADIAFFIDSINKELSKETKTIPKWVVIGGSYAGAMSAWIPHLVKGSIASSAVINAIGDFQEYEGQIVSDLMHCPGTPRNWTIHLLRSYYKYGDEQLYSRKKEVKEKFLEMFNATDMDVLEFQYYFADIPVFYIQRSHRDQLCKILDDIRTNIKEVKDQIKALADITAERGFTARSYKFTKMKNTTIDFRSGSRQWYYQVCSTFGWFQSSFKPNPIRSDMMNMTYWARYCHEIYNKLLFPDETRTNIHVGGKYISEQTSNTYFTHGSNDGWRWAGVLSTNNPKVKLNIIDCEDCAHCIDLQPAKDSDPEVLKQARLDEIKTIKQWFS